MLGLMMNQPLLISGQIEFAAKFHANTEVVTRAVEGPIRRSTYGQVSRRADVECSMVSITASLLTAGTRYAWAGGGGPP